MTTYEEVKQLADPTNARPLTREETAKWWRELHAGVIAPNSRTIANIITSGDIAVAVWEPHALVLKEVQTLGYDGTNPVFRLSNRQRKLLVESFKNMKDTVSERWFARNARNRLFVVTGIGTLIMNLTPDGFVPEPGSTDRTSFDEEALRATVKEWANKS